MPMLMQVLGPHHAHETTSSAPSDEKASSGDVLERSMTCAHNRTEKATPPVFPCTVIYMWLLGVQGCEGAGRSGGRSQCMGPLTGEVVPRADDEQAAPVQSSGDVVVLNGHLDLQQTRPVDQKGGRGGLSNTYLNQETPT